MPFDENYKKTDNSNSFIVIEGDGEQLKVNKRDLQWVRTNHEHHYLPDFTDETDEYVALTCRKGGCIHGVLQRKEGKEFMDWLEGHRAKA